MDCSVTSRRAFVTRMFDLANHNYPGECHLKTSQDSVNQKRTQQVRHPAENTLFTDDLMVYLYFLNDRKICYESSFRSLSSFEPFNLY